MKKDFVHLHVHSQYSLLEAPITLDGLCQSVKALGMNSVALTDSGNMFGAYEFYEQAKAHDIRPIFGAQVFYLTGGSLETRDIKRKDHFLANLILLVENEEGYRNLCQLLSIAHLKGFYYKPRLDKETLKKYSAGLIALSGGVHGEIHRRLINEERDLAAEGAGFLLETYPDRFYLEIQDHGLPLEKKVWGPALELAQEQRLPLVATNEVRYLKAAESEAQIVLTCIQTGRTLNEEEDRGGARSDQMYLKSPEEMRKLFKKYPEAIENSLKIAQQCQFEYSD
ncbi:MAG: PHP domain-containing protein, partial [bacterium]|nr:PHP domain-containing protein [bacterium]